MSGFTTTENIVVSIIILLLAGLLYISCAEDTDNAKKWEVFKQEHNCKITAHVDGELFNTFGTSNTGQITIGIGSTSAKTGWTCDDGVTYYK